MEQAHHHGKDASVTEIDISSEQDRLYQYGDGQTFAMCGPPKCDHDFKGWREFEDGRGGEQVCTKCGLGAMAWTLSLDI
jgi:hypothetical protein